MDKKKTEFYENILYIDYRSEQHNKLDKLIETFKGHNLMKKYISELKYLGFVLSKDGEKKTKNTGKRKKLNWH